jgi:chromosome segregation ATPase
MSNPTDSEVAPPRVRPRDDADAAEEADKAARTEAPERTLAEQWTFEIDKAKSLTRDEVAACAEMQDTMTMLNRLSDELSKLCQRRDQVLIAMAEKMAAHERKAADPDQLRAIQAYNRATDSSIDRLHNRTQEIAKEVTIALEKIARATDELRAAKGFLADPAGDFDDFRARELHSLVSSSPGALMAMLLGAMRNGRTSGARAKDGRG